MRIVFIGTGEIGVPTLRTLQNSEHELAGVITQPDKPVGRDQKITAPPIKAALAGSKIPIFQPTKIKDPTAIEQIRVLKPDVIVVMAYGQILPRAVLEIPRVACLNLHASLLPRWRGAAPIQAAIAAGDPETGITVMYMDEGLDTGDILLQRKIDVLPTDIGASLHDRLAAVAPDALLEALRLLANGNAPRTPQNSAGATSAPKLNRDDGKINWTQSAEAIERKIRAYNKWPGAFAIVREKGGRELKLKIFAAAVVDQQGPAGEVLRADNRGLIVSTGKNALSLFKVQLEGKWPMSGNDFIRGHARLLERKLK
jgi:methionyl-tRNA formyltransferase